MGVMPVIILVSLIAAGGFALFFVIAVRSGQFDDTMTPPIRMLFDDDPACSVSGHRNEPSLTEQNTVSTNLHGRM